ncbi:MAG: IPT/TIG domain-containing protein [Acidimicrobiales bacterium]
MTLTGRGLFSANGHISVTFGPALAPVACPSETTCHVQVPSQRLPGSLRSVPVSIETQSGTSNPVTFTYR